MQLSLLQTYQEVLDLSPAVVELARSVLSRYDLTNLPEYLLARMASSSRPNVVVCHEMGKLVGVMYVKERRLYGIPTGWCFGGDETGRGLVTASAERESEVITHSCQFLLDKGVHALRLRWHCSGDAVPTSGIEGPGLQVVSNTQDQAEGDLLELPDDYEMFLAGVGPHTRRNLRYYRRKAEDEGIRFVPKIDVEEYERVVEAMREVTDFPHDPIRQERDRRFFHMLGEPLIMGLQKGDGTFVSILAAVRFEKSLHVLSQLNDQSLRRMSISVVLRSYLIEQSIELGFTSMHFVNGSSPMLGRYCQPHSMQTILIDQRHSLFHPFKVVGARLLRNHQTGKELLPVRARKVLGSYFAEY
jgi:Acetyltransferase (GNAT) domain